MKKKLACLAIIMAVALTMVLSACGNGGTSVLTDLNVVVLDTYGQPIDGAKITLVQNKSKSTKSDSSGIATLTGVNVGTQKLLIEKEGYATITVEAKLNYGIADNIAVPERNVTTAYLGKLGSSVSGKAVINENGIETPLANAEVRLIIGSSSILNRLFIVNTDAEGNYKFSNLPENVQYSITGATVTKSEVLYDSNTLSGNYTQPSYKADIPLTSNLIYAPAAGQLYITSAKTLKLSANNSSIIINFSQPINVSEFSASNISTNNNILCTYAWSNNNKTLILKPVVGNWGSEGLSFYVYLEGVKSTVGINLSDTTINVSLPNKGTTPAVTGLAVSKDSDRYNYLTIEWNSLENTNYAVYYRVGDSSTYDYTSYYYVNDGKATVSLNNSIRNMKPGETLQIVVYATQNYTKSDPVFITVTKAASESKGE